MLVNFPWQSVNVTTQPATGEDFGERLLAWFDVHGRHDLPWQHPRTPYRVWVSEVMLQQTQVRTVLPYFGRFIAALPTLAALAAAAEDEVLALWSGLGYYSRARNLHRTARLCVERHGAMLPRGIEALRALPGIGRSTAAAILALAHDECHAILDGNVRRVLARHRGIGGWPGETAVANALWRAAESLTPARRVADYTQAIMDLGATVCLRSRPRCARCPVSSGCVALQSGLIDALPQPRPTRALPTRRTAMLILRDPDGRVLLQRRPPVGVWARLWSLPEAADAGAAQALLRDRGILAGGAPRQLESFIHSFSHYHLHITPQLFTAVGPADGIADAPDQRWCSADEFVTLGMPAPVRKLLEHLEDPPCPAPSTAPSSTRTPRASPSRRGRANSASASTSRSRRKPGTPGSRTRPC
jgi:A/G-specific adenine glycosylase